ncbi:MAG: NAD(P)H-hydrate dehydratase [Acidobacteriota bacterium]|nr:NAD(P)H-hydrate dehydratase [Acidobacteriota bacterium]
MEVLDTDRMRRADRHAIEEMRIPGLVLMENAGRLVAESVREACDPVEAQRIVILAGGGNNGGDGFVAARHLAGWGAHVEVVLVGTTRSGLTGDAAAMASAWHGLGGALLELPDAGAWSRSPPDLVSADVLVDALFGTGLSRAAEGLFADSIEAINQAGAEGALVVAIDLPSGLSGTRTDLLGPAVFADVTVTFARPKPAHLLPPAEDLCGDVIVVDIGIPPEAIDRTAPDLHWVTIEEAARLVPQREPDDHKGRFGHVLVVGGSRGKAGAAALAGLGALRAGAGLVTVATPAVVRGEVAQLAAELMTEPLTDTDGGVLAESAADAALELLAQRDVLALGPGVGGSASAAAAVRALVERSVVPVVLDADGLNAFAGEHAGALSRHESPLVMTPHPGEAARLAGVATHEIQADRVGSARRLAALANAVCVLKGYRTIVADPEGRAFINPTGNPGLATAGTGDVLTGLIAGIMAQGCDELEAAILGAFLHGLAADLAVADTETEPTLTATAVLSGMPDAYRALEQAASEDADDDDLL